MSLTEDLLTISRGVYQTFRQWMVLKKIDPNLVNRFQLVVELSIGHWMAISGPCCTDKFCTCPNDPKLMISLRKEKRMLLMSLPDPYVPVPYFWEIKDDDKKTFMNKIWKNFFFLADVLLEMIEGGKQWYLFISEGKKEEITYPAVPQLKNKADL
jgi:hypothetical protein